MVKVRNIVLFVLAILQTGITQVAAQEELKDDRKVERHKEITQSISEPIYRRLNTIHEKIADEKFAEALDALAKMEGISLKKYEQALVFQTFGFAHVQTGNFKLALDYFEKSLQLESLPGAAQQGMLYSLAGLYAAEGQYMKAIETMRRWFRYEAEPVPDAYMVIASSFTELQRYDEALPYVRKAIQLSEEPRENWYMLELAIHFEKSRYRDAVDLLKKMVQFWPDKAQYWDMLVAAHLELNQDKQALDTMMVAYARGMIKSEQKILALAQLNMLLEIPHTAGVIVETAMANGTVTDDKDNLDLLLQAWLSSKEYDRAIRTIDRLGPMAKDGSYFMQKAGIHSERGEWSEVPPAVDLAVEMGLEDPSAAYMLAGMAYAELRLYDKAIAVFQKAATEGNDKQRTNATAWVDFVRDKIAVQGAVLN